MVQRLRAGARRRDPGARADPARKPARTGCCRDRAGAPPLGLAASRAAVDTPAVRALFATLQAHDGLAERRSRCPAPVMRRTCGRHIVCVFLRSGHAHPGRGNQGRCGDRRIAGRTGLSRHGGFCADKIARIVAHPDACWSRKPGTAALGFIGLHFIVQLALPGDFCRITYSAWARRRGLGVGRELEETAARLARDAAATASRCIATSAASTRTASITARGMRNRRST